MEFVFFILYALVIFQMFVYTLGRTLQVATEHGLQPNEVVPFEMLM